MNTNKKRIVGFDYLRGLACILVILFHYTVQYQDSIGHLSEWPVKFYNMGRFGVIVFFVLSGYLSLMHIKDNETFLNYCFKRFVRLYPAYWAGIILTSVVTFFILPQYCRAPWEILVNFTMLQNFLGVVNVDGVYWTLAVELVFYGFIGFVILLKCKKHVMKICYVWLAVISMRQYLCFGNELLLKAINVFLIAESAHIFIIGIALYHLNKGNGINNILNSTVLLILCILYGTYVKGIYEGLFLIVVSAAVYVVTVINIKPYKFLKPLKLYAQISYPAYLVHQFIGFAIIYNLEKIGLTNEIFIIIPIGVSTVLAFLIHKFVEKPVLKLSKNYMPLIQK